MRVGGALARLNPLREKLMGRLPLCPWKAVLTPLSPHSLGGFPPPPDMKVLEVNGAFHKIRFASCHDFWFPVGVAPSPQLWSEYLTVSWDHLSNGHYYFSSGTDVRQGDVCLDCGSCEGFFARMALVKGATTVICVEPSGDMARALRRTFDAEIADGRISVEEAGLSAFCGSASFEFSCERPFGGMFSAPGCQGQTVAVTTLDDLATRLALNRVDFVKMDLEGAELQALEGGMRTLREFHPRLAITTYHRIFDYAALRAMLIAAGYTKIVPSCVNHHHLAVDGFRPVMLHASI